MRPMGNRKKRSLNSFPGFAKRIEVRPLDQLRRYLYRLFPDGPTDEVLEFADRFRGTRYMNPLLLDGSMGLVAGSVALQGLILNLDSDPAGAQDSVPVVQLAGLSPALRSAYSRARAGIEASPPTTRPEMERMMAELHSAAERIRKGWRES